MKFTRTLGIVAVSAFSVFTMGASTVPPAALGQAEGIINFCSKVDSGSAAKYKEWGKRLVANMTEKELKEVRDSSEYKQNYDSTTSELEKVPADKATETCRAALNNGQ